MSNAIPTVIVGDHAKHFNLLRAALAAGFNVGAMKTFGTHDGVAWSTTLQVGKRVVIEARNDGNGGPDQINAPLGKTAAQIEAARAEAKAASERLAAIPEVMEFLRDHEIEVIAYGDKSKEELDAAIAKIRAEPVKVTEEHIGNVIATLAEVRKEAARIKRAAGKKLMWAKKDHKFGQSTSVNVPDTPANREMVIKKWPEAFEGFQGFLTDLVADL
jgi:hypothetical protein